MNIEATATKTTDTSATATATTSASTSAATKDASFKTQLEAVKSQDAKTTETAKTTEDTKTADASATQKNVTATQSKAEEAAKNNIAQQTGAEKSIKDKTSTKDKTVTDPVAELSSKIATLSELKSGISKTQGLDSKTKETTDKTEIGQTIKMDNKDVSFFLNLVENQQMSAQAAQGSASNNAATEFTDVKSEATQQAVQVSSTLLNAMNEASKTGKSVRIDFDSDVAVIMKLDKNGTISANFIPGDAAVENYLRNNIAGLRQNFENQGLAYNELTYTKQQKQQQQEKRKNNEENENE